MYVMHVIYACGVCVLDCSHFKAWGRVHTFETPKPGTHIVIVTIAEAKATEFNLQRSILSYLIA